MGWALGLTLFGGFYTVCELAKSDGYHLAFPAFLFPYAMYALFFSPIKIALVLLIAAQFPVYGVIFAWAWVKDCEAKVGWRLLLFHLLLGIGCALVFSADDLESLWRFV